MDRERIGLPVLSVDRHTIRMPRHQDAWTILRATGGVEIGLLAFVIEYEMRIDIEIGQVVADVLDQQQV